jgi:formylmethanofuran dehydrogenase subunit E
MGLYALELLGQDPGQPFAIIETDGCFADAVSVATGCWLGKRNLRLFDYGKVAVTLIDIRTARSARVYPHPLARARASAFAPTARTRWHSQLEGYQKMPTSELLSIEWVQLTELPARLLGERGERAVCAQCGEEINNARQPLMRRQALCDACAIGAYYVPSRRQSASQAAVAA